jgi:S-adenosylmethionine:tRNA ribosyltransferase-isomerase
MKTSEYTYFLPPGQIAQVPAARRDEARLLVIPRDGSPVEHRRVRDLPELLRPGDLMVFNNTRVIPCRVQARRPGTGGRMEVFFLEPVDDARWRVLLRARRGARVGERIETGSAVFEVEERGERGEAVLRGVSGAAVPDLLAREGRVPLPPYIKRSPGPDPMDAGDRERYQTLYARVPGAVAAPTAGLHFTRELFDQLAERGIGRAELTLHVGLGTFRPVTVEDPEDHRMDPERFDLPAETVEKIEAVRKAGGRIVAVGSTTVRVLEWAALQPGGLRPGTGRLNLFIRPPFEFRIVDAMVTNFHLPESTLLMMVSAFAGWDRVRSAYEIAVREAYRFFSYGDATLLQ